MVTGTGGLGFETALALARAGARVIIAGRDRQKGEDAFDRIVSTVPSPRVHFEQADLVEQADLADLNSIREFASRVSAGLRILDLLVNNAGVNQAR